MDFAAQVDRRPRVPFTPVRALRGPRLQTALTTVRWDVPDSLYGWGTPIVIEAGPDETGQSDGPVRLLAYFTPSESPDKVKGAAILLHGWEGCSDSTYNLVTARELAANGYHVVRLNLRDHGPGHRVRPESLNPGVFLGTLLAESVRGVAQCAAMFDPLPAYLVGFSMGGNFALRIALHEERRSIGNLVRVIAINPAINPSLSTARIDRNPALRRHFRLPWLNQLLAKQRFFPGRYHFDPVMNIASLVDMTTWLVRYLGLYEDAEEYFASYAVLGNATQGLDIPTRVITSIDDMIVPVVDFYGLAPSCNLSIEVHQYGGHMGYLAGCPPRHAVGTMVRQAIECD